MHAKRPQAPSRTGRMNAARHLKKSPQVIAIATGLAQKSCSCVWAGLGKGGPTKPAMMLAERQQPCALRSAERPALQSWPRFCATTNCLQSLKHTGAKMGRAVRRRSTAVVKRWCV
jgi:hypothetical protein